MSPVIDCRTDEGLAKGIAAAVKAVRSGELVVLPTDTVYGVGVDAFAPDAVTAVLAAKGRGREMPPPVLIPTAQTVYGLATSVPAYARVLMQAFWPGPMTLVLLAQTSLMWDLGDTNGTVALRMPKHDTALALLDRVGPMAVTSANVSGQPPAKTIQDAAAQLGSAVTVYLDAGPCTDALPSTILDCTGEAPVILRAGAISAGEVQRVLGDVELGNQQPAPAASGPTSEGPMESGPTSEGPMESGPTSEGPMESGPTSEGPMESGPTSENP